MERELFFVREFQSAGSPHSRLEEAALIRCVAAGDTGRFFDLIHPHLVLVWRTIRARMRNDADAQDVIQETLLKAFKHLAQFRFEASFRTWLCQIAINQVCQTRRDAASWRIADLDEREFEHMLVSDRQDSIEARCERLESGQMLGEAIAALPKKYRQVVQLRDLRELSIDETARSLYLTRSAVKSRHHRARQLLCRQVTGERNAAA
jgi:RNA polymerase sigma-70 factor (ECF subfamily)